MQTKTLTEFIKHLYNTNEYIPLHAPKFNGNESKYVLSTIESTFVSSVGEFVDSFEKRIEKYVGTPKAVATVNGTSALHVALYLADVQRSDLVITQALTFVATCNALYHMGAEPIFLDISPETLGLCPKQLLIYLKENAEIRETGCFHLKTKQRIKAVVPMHTFGHPVELDEIKIICEQWRLTLVEDAAESLGSFYKGHHTGTIGEFGAISFNGNKIITTGGGGVVLCDNVEMGKKAKHITTTAKLSHPYEFYHDEPGFNYRMPNLNAALGCAQLEQLENFLQLKREVANSYKKFFENTSLKFVSEPKDCRSNYWLNSVICPDSQLRDEILINTNKSGVMTRPVWKLMHRLPMFKDSLRGDLSYSEYIEAHLINLPSSPQV